MDKPKTTPKDFFLWAGAVVTLYWSIIAGILLIFNYIDYAFPNPLEYYPSDPYLSGIPYEMASIIVLLPIAMLLLSLIRRDIARDATRKEIWVRRWALIFTLFVAGIAIAIDLITLLTTFLSGEALTTAFLLKVATVLLIASGVFMHFIADFWGYWEAFPAKRKLVDYAVGVVAVVMIGSGFLIVGTPQEARLARYDATRVQDLQAIENYVAEYFRAKQALPGSLSDITGYSIPMDPKTLEAYTYRRTGPQAFSLCATFETVSQPAAVQSRAITPAYPGIKGSEDWTHGAGETCFDRTIDASYYPSLK